MTTSLTSLLIVILASVGVYLDGGALREASDSPHRERLRALTGFLAIQLLQSGYRLVPRATLASKELELGLERRDLVIRARARGATQGKVATYAVPVDARATLELEVRQRSVLALEAVEGAAQEADVRLLVLELAARDPSEADLRYAGAVVLQLLEAGYSLEGGRRDGPGVCVLAASKGLRWGRASATRCARGERIEVSGLLARASAATQQGPARLEEPRPSPKPEDPALLTVALRAQGSWRQSVDGAMALDAAWLWAELPVGLLLQGEWSPGLAAAPLTVDTYSARLGALWWQPLSAGLRAAAGASVGIWMHSFRFEGGDAGLRSSVVASVPLALTWRASWGLELGLGLEASYIPRTVRHTQGGATIWERSPLRLAAGLSVGWGLAL